MKKKARSSWRALTLYGLNVSTYKIALAECIEKFTKENITNVSMELLAKTFFDMYLDRLSNGMPQLNNAVRSTVVENTINRYKNNILNYEEAIEEIKKNAFNDVLPRFHMLFGHEISTKFYERTKSGIIITDSAFEVFDDSREELMNELDARWSLLESAFKIKKDNSKLINDVRMFYLEKGYERTSITYMKDMLSGYQEGRCFYCEEKLDDDIHVDHVIPRMFVNHDEPWNLVLSHAFCNESKSDKLPSEYYIEKLIDRNERLISSNHPLSKGIIESLGITSQIRKKNTFKVYDDVLSAVGKDYIWKNSNNLNFDNDPFYKSLMGELKNL